MNVINMFNLNQEVRGMMEKDTSRKLSQIVKYGKDNNLILQLPLTDRDGTPLPDDVTDSLHSVLRDTGARFSYIDWSGEQTKYFITNTKSVTKVWENGEDDKNAPTTGMKMRRILSGVKEFLCSLSEPEKDNSAGEYMNRYVNSAVAVLKETLPISVAKTDDAFQDYINIIKILLVIALSDVNFGDGTDYFLNYCNGISYFFIVNVAVFDFDDKEIADVLNKIANGADISENGMPGGTIDDYIRSATDVVVSELYGCSLLSTRDEFDLQTVLDTVRTTLYMVLNKISLLTINKRIDMLMDKSVEAINDLKKEYRDILNRSEGIWKSQVNSLTAEIKMRDEHIDAYKKAFIKCNIPDVKVEDDEDECKDTEKIAAYENTISELERQNKKLADKLQKAVEESDDLRAEIKTLAPDVDYDVEEKGGIKLQDIDVDAKYIFVLKTRQKLDLESQIKLNFKNAVIADDPKVINQSADLVIFLTKWISHSLYSGAKRICKDNKIPYMHCPNSNIDMIKADIWRYYNS